MSKRYDLIVVGAGPAGLMAAKTAAENGLRTALLERKTNATKLHRVDGGAIGINEYLFNQIVTFNHHAKKLCFPVSGFSVSYDGPYRNVYGFQVYSPGGKRILFGDWEEARRRGDAVRVGISLDKEILLQGLLKECEHYGVEVFTGTNVTDVRKVQSHVEVTGNGKIFEGTLVIAADGVNSRIARILGFNKERKFLGTERGLTWVMQGDIPIEPGSFNFVITKKGIAAVLTSFREDLFDLTTYTFDTRIDLNAFLDYFVSRDPTYSPWFTRAKKIKVVNCVANQLSPLKEPFRENVLLIGDAAWILEFSNMAALCCGWKAGNSIALAFLDNKIGREGLESYLEWWEHCFYIPYGKTEFGFGGGELIDLLTEEEIDYLISLVEKPLPATMNFFTLFNQIGRTYAELFPIIEKERPEVMGKLMEIRSRMDDFSEKFIKLGFPNR